MKAITAKYYGPTNHQPARIKVSMGKKELSKYYSYNTVSPTDCHSWEKATLGAVTQFLSEKLGWGHTYLLHQGTLDMDTEVFIPEVLNNNKKNT